ncbi:MULTISPECIES: hypothetical protein [unclassified Clostridium]|uniref:hypothetical protein n=1 Tax=unclassified Clostridium TaxID=2614128 RepID=UPI00052D130F|nr:MULTISPECIES: hypothetical protein [unclassified Clostridium]KGK81921.1 hypothetical protein DP68_17945 [Clostridium sp. HMP27]
MYKEAWEKYREGFRILLPFILVKLLFQISSFKFTSSSVTLDKYDMITGGETLLRNISGANGKAVVISNLFLIIISILAVPLVYSFLYLVIKIIVRDEEVNYKEAFIDSLHFYLRYLTLTIIIGALIIGISLLSIFTIMIPFFIIAVMILLVYVVVTVIPCEAYLIYHDVSAEEAFSEGRKIGKKYFWKLAIIGVITSLIASVLKIIPDTNIIVYAAKSFITIFIGFYMHIFAMILCKQEEG